MLRTFRYPLHPTKAQAAELDRWMVACCELYNGALENRIGAWKRGRVRITRYDQQKELTCLRFSDPDWASIPVEAERSAISRLDRAFMAFYRRCKSGEKPGFPRFRSRDRYDSFSVSDRATIAGDRVILPKLGGVRFHRYRQLRGKIKGVIIRRSCGKWFVCFACELGDAPEKSPVRSAAGIDLGLNAFAFLSDGSAIDNPRYFRRGEELLAGRQRALALKKLGSESRKRSKLLVSKAHEHVRQQRLDFSRKLACALLSGFDLIAYEDLNIRGMLRGNLSKSIADAAWGTFISCLTSKAASAGKWAVAVDPKGTSQRCSGCGAVVKKTLSERQHRCGCGLILDRDHNAALNILALSPGRGEPSNAKPKEAQRDSAKPPDGTTAPLDSP